MCFFLVFIITTSVCVFVHVTRACERVPVLWCVKRALMPRVLSSKFNFRRKGSVLVEIDTPCPLGLVIIPLVSLAFAIYNGEGRTTLLIVLSPMYQKKICNGLKSFMIRQQPLHSGYSFVRSQSITEQSIIEAFVQKSVNLRFFYIQQYSLAGSQEYIYSKNNNVNILNLSGSVVYAYYNILLHNGNLSTNNERQKFYKNLTLESIATRRSKIVHTLVFMPVKSSEYIITY